MTKNTKQQDDQDLQELQDMVDDLEKKEEENSEWEQGAQIQQLQNQLQQVETQLKEKEEIAQKAQIAYLHVKSDFDLLTRQTQAKTKTLEQDLTIKIVKKMLPFIENLRKSLATLTEEQKADNLGKGVQMIYDGCLKSLADLSIFPIDAVGCDVDSQLHEPVSLQPIDDKKLKGKIVSVFEQGFFYEKDDVKIVIIPAKVIVGQ